MRSIRIFMLVTLLSTIVLVNFVSALQGYRASMAEAQQLFDQQMAATAQLLSAMPVPQKIPVVVDHTGSMAFQVWADEQSLLMRSNNAPQTPVSTFAEGYREINFSGYRWRVFTHHAADLGAWVQVAERIDLRFQLADRVILESVSPILIGIPVAGLLIWLILGRGLSSLRKLAAALQEKRAEDLRPLPIDSPPVELQSVVSSTNALLARLQGSFDRERRFSADAAHELRTPISAIQVHAHNVERELSESSGGERQLAHKPDSLAKLQASVERMSHLVEQMLDLYRTTPDHYPARFESVDIYTLAREIIAENYAGFAAREQQVELRGASATLDGDRFALSILLKNLLRNANKYSPEGGRIEVSVRPLNDAVELRVEDSGPGIAEEEYARVFERFYRIGGDRHTSTVEGCGLGLSIVQHIAQLHHADIKLGTSHFGHGLSVQVRFPRRGPNREQATDESIAQGETNHA
ncbi:ATP-binding protein [Microbulbifer hydrolyticus]|uniref:histidine kinase n=1 Tax=Microbulbifer hydrolyticus TaxID=48074 RepID=A0A6P1TF31_9GAMM|nr:ATP-binding protein [Microbulbifer hydrolyticus]MBB5212643.1 two-component system sensor histidine kinase QseC [Microbulbifer hydrolyticus]QHQ40245.1 sensor histidine kinase [Microbulbifer hydrolyticus]